MVDSVGVAWTVFSTIYTHLANMEMCKELAAQLKQRLQVLEEPMKKLRKCNVGGSAGVDRLVSNLSQLEAIIIRICKRSGFVRFLTSSGDNEDLERFNRYVTDCVADLSLLTQLQIADDIRHLRWRNDKRHTSKAHRPMRHQRVEDTRHSRGRLDRVDSTKTLTPKWRKQAEHTGYYRGRFDGADAPNALRPRRRKQTEDNRHRRGRYEGVDANQAKSPMRKQEYKAAPNLRRR
jgi:hypothetical protein